LAGEVEADTAFGVSGGVENVAGEAFSTLLRVSSDCDDLAFVERVVRAGYGGGGDAEPGGLNVHHFDLGEVVLVVEDGGAGELLEAVGAGDVVDVGVGDDDLLDDEVVFGEEGHDSGDVVAGVDDDGFVGGLVAEDGAVALEGTNGEDFVDHGSFRLMANGQLKLVDLWKQERQRRRSPAGMTTRKATAKAKGQGKGERRRGWIRVAGDC